MASGVYPELDLQLTERTRRRRVRGRSRVVELHPVPEAPEIDLPGVITVDPITGEVEIDLRTIEEKARSLDLLDESLDEPPQSVHVIPRAAHNGAKRLFDLGIVALTAPLWAPLLVLLAGLIRITSRGPAFYRHVRVGRGGRPIGCLKLRTMVRDADARLTALLESDPVLADEFALTHKLKDDPRVTRVGRFLRKTSLDELPQLVNVLRGEMSLVGPRPITKEEMRRYGQYMPIVLSARPGMTGLWQVSGRNDVSYATRVALDVQYTFGQSLGGDVTIMIRTVKRVLHPSDGGAY